MATTNTKQKKMVTIGIDSSTTNCGVAIFENGKLLKTQNFEFSGTYSLDKLEKITKTFQTLFDKYNPGLIVLETPAPVRNSKTLTALNQVAGAIWATAIVKNIFIADMHNKVIKKLLNVHSKQEGIERVAELFGIIVKTDHESDAVLTVEAYRMMVTRE
ncbi:crossover junction endodeoxyribonuclease RuvC [candidate division WWE3 bacterium]|nr:crossover junction endodeoxyribonuclease RuvC [candidate division WWE3 bacterium]